MSSYEKVRDMINERDRLKSGIEQRREAMKHMFETNAKEFDRLLALDEQLAAIGIYTTEYIRLQKELHNDQVQST
jgi:hypothetical protein